MNLSVREQIVTLKRQRNAVILVHSYQRPEVQDLGDFVGARSAVAMAKPAAGKMQLRVTSGAIPAGGFRAVVMVIFSRVVSMPSASALLAAAVGFASVALAAERSSVSAPATPSGHSSQKKINGSTLQKVTVSP